MCSYLRWIAGQDFPALLPEGCDINLVDIEIMTHQPTMTLILHLNDVPLDVSRGDACVAPTGMTGVVGAQHAVPYDHADDNPPAPCP